MEQTRLPQPQDKKPYQQPGIVYEAKLEAHAGSPLGDSPLGDLLDLPGE